MVGISNIFYTLMFGTKVDIVFLDVYIYDGYYRSLVSTACQDESQTMSGKVQLKVKLQLTVQ